MSDYVLRFQKAIRFLDEHNNFKLSHVAEKLEKFKKAQKNERPLPATSKPQLSRYFNGKATVTRPVIDLIEAYLNSLRIQWNENLKKYEALESNSSFDEYQLSTTFDNVMGIYEVYHLSENNETILKNILRIDEQGQVQIDGYSDCTHEGEAIIFQGNFLSIQIHTLCNNKGKKTPFFYQMLANIAGYAQNGTIRYFTAVSTTVAINHEVMSNKRIFIKISNNSQEHKELKHCVFFVTNEQDLEELNQSQAGRIADFLLHSSTLTIKQKTNEKI